ncbi:LysR family transcriptional regulator [Pseudalkalibacillus sp. A8]
MNKHWIEAFICVSRMENMSKAAEVLFLTHPSVSSGIQSL